MQQVPPDNSLRSLAEQLGELPGGDLPRAWYMSLHQEVLAGYERYRADVKSWNDAYAELLTECGLESSMRYMADAKAMFLGLIPPALPAQVPRWLREDRRGLWVPRKRTKAERLSRVSELFGKLEKIPQAGGYLVGMPSVLVTQKGTFPLDVRKPAKAVLVFLGVDPVYSLVDDKGIPQWQVSGHWSRMKLSTFHMLRERQAVSR